MRKVNRESDSVQRESDFEDSKVLMAARVSKRFHERVQAECVRREMSLQKLVTTAVAAYMESEPESESHGSGVGTPAHLLTLGFVTDDSDGPLTRARNRLWSTYQDKMPDEKIDILVRAMKWDLQMRKSARRKRTE